MQIRVRCCVAMNVLIIDSAYLDRLRVECRNFERNHYARSTIYVRSIQVRAYMSFF